MQNKIQILCTKKISNSLIQLAEEYNISFDELNFIKTEESVSEEVRKRIIELSTRNISAIFTSSNAVNAVEKIVYSCLQWKIYCIEPGTKKKIENAFEKALVAGTAKDATGLSEIIIKDKPVNQVVFFCGNQRRDILPDKLNANGIRVEELIVYKTIANPHLVSKNYDGILFFSPSAVKSFFSKNEIQPETILFAIGKTTAEEVKNYSNNTTIISVIPDTKTLIADVIKHFSSIKIFK